MTADLKGKHHKSKKHLKFSALVGAVAKHVENMPDKRDHSKIDYTLHDVILSGLAMKFFQDPSLLQFQKRMQEDSHNNNLKTLFGVQNIPKSTQLRSLIDSVPSHYFEPIFKDYFLRLQRAKTLEPYRVFDKYYLCTLDGSQDFSSDLVHCDSCLKKTHKKETSKAKVTYSHQILQPAIVHPDKRQVIPLMPEEIKNSDGNKKQDCEINAAKRLVQRTQKDHPQLPLIWLGDGLYSKTPFINTLTRLGYSYILVAKDGDHSYLMQSVDDKEQIGEVKTKFIFEEKKNKRKQKKKGKLVVLGRTLKYEWVNGVPLNGQADAPMVNFLRFSIIEKYDNGSEKITYKCAWVSNLEINATDAPLLVKSARSRWKSENECFNTLKNQGYHMEHNFGHGSENLCFNFLLLTLLAFFLHQIFELSCRLYQECRLKCGSKRHLWETLRSYIKLLIFRTWELLLGVVLNSKTVNASFLPP